MNTGAVTRGHSVAVIGCGGVGCTAIAGLRLAGATRVIGVDVDERKLEWAKRLGATHTAGPAKWSLPFASSQTASAPTSLSRRSADPRPTQAFYARDLAGTLVLVGVPTPEMRLDLALLEGEVLRSVVVF